MLSEANMRSLKFKFLAGNCKNHASSQMKRNSSAYNHIISSNDQNVKNSKSKSEQVLGKNLSFSSSLVSAGFRRKKVNLFGLPPHV